MVPGSLRALCSKSRCTASSRPEPVRNVTKGLGSWNGATPFPFVQGTDCCGEVVGRGEGTNRPDIGKGEIRPLVAKTFALKDIATAQKEFLKKTHFGNFVLVPPHSLLR